jgi:hypothetical protein
MVGRGIFARVGLATLAGLALWSVRAHADEQPGPTTLFPGPSLYETGRIGGMSPEGTTAAIAPGELAARNEKSVSAAAAELETPAKPSQGIISENVLRAEIDSNFGTLEECRVDVARARQILPSTLTADTLLLRWRIEPDGSTTTTDVVATSAVDMRVMDCVKETMSQWTFTSPRGGSVSVERAFAFRHLPTATAPTGAP